MLNIGTKVKFKGKSKRIPDFTCDPTIPIELIKHGSTKFSDYYNKNGAIITNVHNQYYLVEFIDINNKTVCLGFTKDKLIPISWRSRYEKRN